MMGFLDYAPNEAQTTLIAAFARFCLTSPSDSVFLLNGYAGTGKTSMTGALVRTLHHINRKTVLLAPTGRAGCSRLIRNVLPTPFTAKSIVRRVIRPNMAISGLPTTSIPTLFSS